MSAINRHDRPGSVLLIDVADSTSKPDFRDGRDRRIERLNGEHRERGWIAADYTVTAWDEFQSVSWERQHLPRILLDPSTKRWAERGSNARARRWMR
jgi:hypothetical protein